MRLRDRAGRHAPRHACAFGLSGLATILVLASVVALGGCAETTLAVNTAKMIQPETSLETGGYKVGGPYQIDGRWYTPEDNLGYNEVGMASWYGPKFHGRTTANGERFDQNALTAAHPTLPMPSLVQVTNLSNGRSVTLRVNDRGPFSGNRIIDVSKRAAEVLGFRREGTARVRVTILADESLALRRGGTAPAGGPIPTPAAALMQQVTGISPALPATQVSAANGGRWYIQAGAFSDPVNASRVASHLRAFAPAALSPITTDAGLSLMRVRLGPVDDSRQAARLLQVVRSSGYPGARLVAH